MLVFDVVAGAILLLAVVGVLMVGIAWARRSQADEEAVAAARRAGTIDLVPAAVSQAELDEALRSLTRQDRQPVLV